LSYATKFLVLAVLLMPLAVQAQSHGGRDAGKRNLHEAHECASHPIELKPAAGPDQTREALQNAIGQAATTGCPIRLKPGIYLLNRSIAVEADRVAIVCDPGAVFRKTGQANTILFKGASGSIAGRCEIDGAGQGGSGLIVEKSATDTRIEHVFSHHNGGHGILNTGTRTFASENRTEDNRKVGFANSTAVGATIVGLSSRRNGNEGLTIDNPGTAHMKIQGGLVEDNCKVGGVGNIGIDAATDVTVTDVVAKNPSLPCKWNLTAQNNVGNTLQLHIKGGTYSGARDGDIHFRTNSIQGFTVRDSSVRQIVSKSPVAVLADPGTSRDVFQVEGKVVNQGAP
jgi:hypothetical protein